MGYYEERQKWSKIRIIIITFIVFFIGTTYYKGTLNLLISPASSESLNSEYVIKLPASYAQSDPLLVTAYGTAQCFAGPVKSMQGKIPTTAKWNKIDLNASPEAGRKFMKMLRDSNQTHYNVPAYQVKNYIIFSNKDAALQIRAALSEAPPSD